MDDVIILIFVISCNHVLNHAKIKYHLDWSVANRFVVSIVYAHLLFPAWTRAFNIHSLNQTMYCCLRPLLALSPSLSFSYGVYPLFWIIYSVYLVFSDVSLKSVNATYDCWNNSQNFVAASTSHRFSVWCVCNTHCVSATANDV